MTNPNTNQATHSHSVEALFRPFTLGNLNLANQNRDGADDARFLTRRCAWADVADYYRRRAENGVGLIITEGTLINHPAATDDPESLTFMEKRRLQAGNALLMLCTKRADVSCHSSGISG